MADGELQVRGKKPVVSKAEEIRKEPQFIPAVDIYETTDALTLVADMPGVKKDGVDIRLEDNQLAIRGRVSSEAANETTLLSEYTVGDYVRTFTLSEVIDQSKIEAVMKNGVLTLTLPKVQAAKPRQITVKSE
jgi:HSP20 family protein